MQTQLLTFPEFLAKGKLGKKPSSNLGDLAFPQDRLWLNNGNAAKTSQKAQYKTAVLK